MTPAQQTRAIINEVAERHGITYDDLMTSRRYRAIAWPRQEAMYEVCKRRPWLSLPDVGRIFGGRDHTTILHGLRKHCEREGISYEKFSFERKRRYYERPGYGAGAEA